MIFVDLCGGLLDGTYDTVAGTLVGYTGFFDVLLIIFFDNSIRNIIGLKPIVL